MEQVILLKRIYRCDPIKTKGCPNNIKIAKQSLECDGDLRTARFGSPSHNGYDGTHLRGKMAVQHYTGSLLNILLDIFSGTDFKESKIAHQNKQFQKPLYSDILKNTTTPNHQSKYEPRSKPRFAKQQFQRSDYYNLGNYNKINQHPMSGPSRGKQTYQSDSSRWGGWTGNSTAAQGSEHVYNVGTQNRFTMSGN